MSQVSALLLEGHANLRGHQAECTLNTKVEGVTVTGRFNLYYEGGVLTDYKFVSVWTTMNSVKEAWEQLNLYAHLLGAAPRRVRLEMLRRNGKLRPLYCANLIRSGGWVDLNANRRGIAGSASVHVCEHGPACKIGLIYSQPCDPAYPLFVLCA